MNIIEKELASLLARNWWVLLLRGLLAIAFGVLIWMRPGISLAALVLLFGAYVMADGVLGVWTAISERKDREHWWVLLLWGLVGIAVGIMTFMAPGITALSLLFYIAIWAIVSGVLQVVSAIRLRKEIDGEWLLILGGLASVAFGVMLMAQPGAGVLAVLWLIALYSVFFGVLFTLFAFKARSFKNAIEVK